MKKKVKVVMLPTKNKTVLTKHASGNPLYYEGYQGLNYPFQHLYLVSNDEIVPDDHMYHVLDKEVIRYKPQGIENPKEYGYHVVIASTDKSLSLPIIPDSFIKEYVKEQGKIDEVYCNIVDNGREEWMGSDSDGEPFWNEDLQAEISRVKDSYSREEVIELTKKAYFAGNNIGGLGKWQEENL